MDSISYADPETINGLNLYAYCGNNPVNYYDPSGNFIISIGTLLTLGAIAAGSAVLGWIESTFHPIQNTIESIGDGIADIINNVQINSIYDSISDYNLNLDSNIIYNELSDLFDNYYYVKGNKQKYKPKNRGVRVRGKSKKDAYEKAKRRGGGKTPIHHKGKYNDKHGKWIGPYYHPRVPNGHPFAHDHYFYVLFLLLGLDFDE